MDGEDEKKLSDSLAEVPAATLANLEYLKYQLPCFHGDHEKDAKLSRNPAAVAEIYRNAMKKPGEILVSQSYTDLKHDK